MKYKIIVMDILAIKLSEKTKLLLEVWMNTVFENLFVVCCTGL